MAIAALAEVLWAVFDLFAVKRVCFPEEFCSFIKFLAFVAGDREGKAEIFPLLFRYEGIASNQLQLVDDRVVGFVILGIDQGFYSKS